MSPTPKKKRSVSFWQCVECCCILSTRDALKHSEFCQKPKSEWPCGYIKDHTLYGCLEDYEDKEKDNGAKRLKGEIRYSTLFMSRSAMCICGFSIGCPVIVEIQGYSTIMYTFPSSGNTLTVSIFKKAFELLSGLKLTSSNVKVSKLRTEPSAAKEVFFQLLSPEGNDSCFSGFTKVLPYKFNEKVILVGMNLIVQQFGRRIRVKISKVDKQEGNISADLENLCLNDVCYTTQSTTIWTNEALKESVDKKDEILYKKIGGYESIISELKRDISHTFSRNSDSEDILSLGILLYGPSGTGKTVISQHLAHTSGKEVINIRGFDMFSKLYGESDNRLERCFEDAKKKRPCVIIMDNVEMFCSKDSTDQQKRLLSTLISMFDSIRNYPIVVIACTVDPKSLDPLLRSRGRLEREVEIPIPDSKDCYEILKTLLPDPALDEVITHLSTNCYGYVGGDLTTLVDKAIQQAIGNNELTVTAKHLQWAFTQIRPSAMRELQVHVPKVSWSDIGGGKDVRQCLEQAVVWPLKFPDSLARLGIEGLKGVLLYGPPGCSKTLTVKALATETKLNFISIKGSDVYSKWVGESEKTIHKLFQSARKVAPSIVFIDEADALCASRGNSGTNTVQDRVLAELLTEMDGVTPLSGVVVVAATNRPDLIDEALLRPGRLDRIIYVPLPDYESRMQIFEIRFKMTPTKDVNIAELATKTDGYSGAEIVAVCKEAAIIALQEDISAPYVQMSHFLKALKSITPRTPACLLKLYDEFSKKRH